VFIKPIIGTIVPIKGSLQLAVGLLIEYLLTIGEYYGTIRLPVEPVTVADDHFARVMKINQ
jgi:hypothetical protein